MKNLFFLTALLVVCPLLVRSQEEAKVLKNNIGFSTNFFSGSASPFAVMYKRNVKSNLALRVGVGMNASNTRSDDETTNTQVETSNSTITPGLGLEWQNSLSKGWVWYVGADVRESFGWNKAKQFLQNQPLTETNTYTTTTTLSPFAGLRYNIMDQLYVATEAYLVLSQSTQTRNIISYTANTNATTEFKSNSASLGPAVSLLLFSRF